MLKVAANCIGGPSGGRSRGRTGSAVLRVLLAISLVTLSLGILQKQHCRENGWTSPDQFFHACYSDIPAVYSESGLADGVMPYLDSASGQYLAEPVLTGLVMYGVAQLVPPGATGQKAFFDFSTLVIAILFLALVALTLVGAGRVRPWDAALVAASPLMVLAGLVSVDLLGVVLAAAGVVLWGKSRPLAAGIVLGLAIAARTYPMMLVLVIGLLALRAGKLAEWTVTLLAACLTVVSLMLPWLIINPAGIRAAYRGWIADATGYGSPWLIPQLFFGPAARLPVVVTTSLAVIGMGIALLLAGWLALGANRRPRVAQLALIAVALVVVTGKSWPVQASLWLLPLAVWANPRWRDHLIWCSTECLYFAAVWLNVAGQSRTDRGLPDEVYAIFILIRMLGMLWLIWVVRCDILTPEKDLVRAEGGPIDPLAGPLAGAPDVLLMRLQ